MIDEDVSRRTIALSIRTGKLTARVLAYALRAAGRKIQKERRAHQTPHGRQSVKKLMAHGAATNSIELTGAPKEFDRVARKWNVDYAFYKTGPDKYLLFFKSGQGKAISPPSLVSSFSTTAPCSEITSQATSRSVPERLTAAGWSTWAVSGASRVRTITGQTSNGRSAVYSFPSSSVTVTVRT